MRLRSRNTNCAPLFDSAYLDRIEEMWKQGYYLKKTPEGNKELVKSAITTEWKTAKQISDSTGVSYKAVSKILVMLSMIGYVKQAEQHWVDDRFRKRKRYIYKIDNSADGVLMLSRIFGAAARFDPSKLNLTGNVTRHTME